ncbi:hypothetical protein TcWFU_001348 [Taenia crassiceps]|uniref:Homeobox domain-containing protein n=1 Tax=Taenia crassiceps TaxID=6207 RepID=A0ABR4PZ24_9CEST
MSRLVGETFMHSKPRFDEAPVATASDDASSYISSTPPTVTAPTAATPRYTSTVVPAFPTFPRISATNAVWPFKYNGAELQLESSTALSTDIEAVIVSGRSCRTAPTAALLLQSTSPGSSLHGGRGHVFAARTAVAKAGWSAPLELETEGSVGVRRGAESIAQSSSRRQRTVYTPEQLRALEELFAVNKYPDLVAREQLAARLELAESRVQVWFKNRRAKLRNVQRQS